MRTTIEFLDGIKARYGLTSDYQVAKKLAVSTQAVYNYRGGKSRFDDAMAIKVAELLEIDPGLVISAIHAERAKSDVERKAWVSMWEKLGGLAASITLGIALSPAQELSKFILCKIPAPRLAIPGP